MAGPLDPLITMLKSTLSGTSSSLPANPWNKVAINPTSPPVHDFSSHYQAGLDQGLNENEAWQSALGEHKTAPPLLQIQHTIKNILPQNLEKEITSLFHNSSSQTPASSPQVSAPVAHSHVTLNNTDTSPVPDDYIQVTRPDNTGPHIPGGGGLAQKRSNDYKRNLPIFTPEAQQVLTTSVKPQEIQDYYQTERKHNHLDNSEMDARQAMLYNVAKKQGNFNADQFYKDLEQTALTNPTVYLHAMHHSIAYSEQPPEERALNVMAHVGAFFGSDIYYTPLGKYYQGIIDPNTPSTVGYAFDPETVWKAKDVHYFTPEQMKNDNAYALDRRLRTMGVPPPDAEPLYPTMPLNYPATTDPSTLTNLEKTYTANRATGMAKWLGDYAPGHQGIRWHHY